MHYRNSDRCVRDGGDIPGTLTGFLQIISMACQGRQGNQGIFDKFSLEKFLRVVTAFFTTHILFISFY